AFELASFLPNSLDRFAPNQRFVILDLCNLILRHLYFVRGPICLTNQSLASFATFSSAPGSSNKWVAPGTISILHSHFICARACSFSSITTSSSPPTISSVGAFTFGNASPAKSGRPPRDTTAPTSSGNSAAATSAAPPPVL